MPRYIDADRIVVDAIKERKFVIREFDPIHDHDVVIRTAYADLAEFIDAQPTANVVEVKRGRWLLEPPYRTATGYYKSCICPFCHSFFISDGNENWKLHPFCCECGASLIGGEERNG